jgi:Flp pilus assembly protein CpaB
MMVVASAMAVFASIAAFAAIYSSSDRTSAVLVVTESIQQGQHFSGSDLGEANVSISSGVNPILVADASELAGKRAAVTIPAGSLLVPSDVTGSPQIPAGEAVVGLALKPGQLPSNGVEPGDQVMIVQTASPGTPVTSPLPSDASGGASVATTGILVPQATVFDTAVPPVNSSSGATALVSVEVATTLASAVSTASAAGQVSLVLLPPESGGDGGRTSGSQAAGQSP